MTDRLVPVGTSPELVNAAAIAQLRRDLDDLRGTALARAGGTSAGVVVLAAGLALDVPLLANTTTDIFTTDPLDIGDWVVTMDFAALFGGANTIEAHAALGTATATFTGPTNAADGPRALNHRSHLSFTFLASVTVAGTLKGQGYSQTNAATIEAGGVFIGGKATGWTAVKAA